MRKSAKKKWRNTLSKSWEWKVEEEGEDHLVIPLDAGLKIVARKQRVVPPRNPQKQQKTKPRKQHQS